MINISKEVAKEPFDPDEFVERLARHTIEIGSGRDAASDCFDLTLLHDTFTRAISDLNVFQERQKKKCEQLEVAYKEEEGKDLQKIALLQERNKCALAMFHELDERINYVAAKVIHLGDQLESVNVPRSRAVEAQLLMRHFQDFLVPQSLLDEVFTDSSRLNEAADIIQKLCSIAQELPDDQFREAKMRIDAKYREVERNLIEEFVRAHRDGEIARMKEIADLLFHFKNYAQCIDAFIEHSQEVAFLGDDLFRDAIPLCERNNMLMKEVFSNPEDVMAKFVLNFFSLKLQKYIVAKLSNRSDLGKYLKTLHELYSKTLQTSEALTRFNMGNDDKYLSKLTALIFQKDLDGYIGVENRFLKDRCTFHLQRYYDSKNHQKKQIQTGGFQDLRRDIQAVIGNRANINIAQIEDYGGETFVSEELSQAILQDSRISFHRCKVLSQPTDVATNAVTLLETVLQNLLVEHVDYALELGLQAIPIPESKTFPQIYFFDLVRRTNSIVQMLDKFYTDCVTNLVASTPKQNDCLDKERYVLESIESKLESGLDRCVNAIVSWVKIYLQSEQKRSDFKPETEKKETLPSSACLTVCQNMITVSVRIRESLDSRNAEAVLTELGTRFHRVVYEHLSQYQFNTSEAVYAVCDVIEYKKCASELKVPLVITLFDTLHALWNLLLVRPENLRQVCSDGLLADLDESVLLNFIQLRSDYKTQKLANMMKGLSSSSSS